eukprot:281006_1
MDTIKTIITGYMRKIEKYVLSNPNYAFPQEVIALCYSYFYPRFPVKLAKVTDRNLSYNNCVYLNPLDMKTLLLSNDSFLLIDDQQIFRVKPDTKLEIGHLGSTNLLWKSLHLQLKSAVGTKIPVQPLKYSKENKNTVISTISIIVDTYSKVEVKIQSNELQNYIRKQFAQQIFCENQRFVIKWHQSNQTYWLSLLISSIFSKNNNKQKNRAKLIRIKFGIIDSSTSISLISTTNRFIQLIESNPIIIDIWPRSPLPDYMAMGIGGYNEQLNCISRRVIISRLYAQDVVQEMHVKHTKGILLYGPHGVGKSLIARTIGSILTETNVVHISAAEILNDEVLVNEFIKPPLFFDAIVEQREKGFQSSIYVYIFDDIEKLNSTAQNGLMSYMNGAQTLNNAVIFGLTSRIDLVNDMLLRAGRFDVQIEIGLPDEDSRLDIFRIYTKKLREQGFFDENISCYELAKQTQNYTCGEIEAVVRSAVLYAVQQNVYCANMFCKPCRSQLDFYIHIHVTQQCFDAALEEIVPEYSRKKIEKQLLFAYNNGIYIFNEKVQEIIDLCKNISRIMTVSHGMCTQSLLIKGSICSGKTAMSSYIAHEIVKFAFVGVIAPGDYIGMSDTEICAVIDEIFIDAYQSDESIIIIDDLDRIIGYNSVGEQFSDSILKTILTCIKRVNIINKKRKLFIIATSMDELSEELSLDEQFNFVRNMPIVKCKQEFQNVLIASGYDRRCKPDVNSIVESFPVCKSKCDGNGVVIGDLLTVLQLAINFKNDITLESFLYAWKSKFKSRVMSE